MSRKLLFSLCIFMAMVAAASADAPAAHLLHPTVIRAKTACEEHKERERENTTPAKLDVKCLPNGDYAPLQCYTTVGYCYCASPNGTRVTGTTNIRKHCDCEVAKNKVYKTLYVNGMLTEAPRGTWVPNCDPTGIFRPKQCETGTDLCWCVTQAGVDVSKEKKVGINCTGN